MSEFVVILFVNFVLPHDFSHGKTYIPRKVYFSSFHKNKRFIISNFLEWDTYDLLSKHQAVSKVTIFLISVLYVNSVLPCAFSLGKLCISGKVYLSSFHQNKWFMISNFLEWDMHNLLSKHEAVNKVTNFLTSVLFVNSVLPCVFSLVKLYIIGKLYISGF